jgi:hypothetical protein
MKRIVIWWNYLSNAELKKIKFYFASIVAMSLVVVQIDKLKVEGSNHIES